MNHHGTSVNTKLSNPPTSGTKLYSVTSLPKLKELLVYVSASCPFTQSGNEKWALVTCHRKNNKPYVDASRIKQTIKTITKEHAVKQNTRMTDNTMLPSTGRVSSTNASGSKLRSNTKNDRITQPSNCNANVKNVDLSKNSDTSCLSCNECLFSTNHDDCVVQYLKKMQKCKVAKSTKQKENHAPSSSNNTSTIVVPPGHILTTTVIPVDIPYPKLSLRYVNSWGSLSKCTLNTQCHPFNLHDFGFEGIIQDEELPH
ncbi:hypothetical protein Tco_0461108 [Tanacetum coccineum]